MMAVPSCVVAIAVLFLMIDGRPGDAVAPALLLLLMARPRGPLTRCSPYGETPETPESHDQHVTAPRAARRADAQAARAPHGLVDADHIVSDPAMQADVCPHPKVATRRRVGRSRQGVDGSYTSAQDDRNGAMRTSKMAATTLTSPVGRVAQGDYLCSERDLYYVEHVGPDRALLEDCRTNTLLDLSIADLERLRPVVRADKAS